MQLELAPDRWLTYVSRGAASELQAHDSAIFKGYAIDYPGKSVIFGARGFSDYCRNLDAEFDLGESLEGCYFGVRWGAETVDISNDLFSLCPMLYFSSSELVAVSDSTYILAHLRGALGLPCTMDEESAVARSWGNAMAGQMLSEDGFINEIKYAHVGVSLSVRLGDDIQLRVVRRNVREVFCLRERSYVEAVRTSAQRIASVLGSLAEISMNSLSFALSGGTDSRVCLAAAILSRAGREHPIFNCVNTNSSHKRDFEVVSALSQRFGFPLGVRGEVVKPAMARARSAKKLGSWFLSNSGIYDFLYASPAATEKVERLSVGGHGAELHKGNYGWRRIGVIAKTIEQKSVREAFRSQCEKGITAMGLEPDDVFGSEWHYLGFRNAIHSGRFVMSTMAGMRPLMTRDLVALSRSELNELSAPKKGGQSLITDLLICLSPELAAQPFDDPKKDLAISDIQVRSGYLRGPLSSEELDRYKVYGELGSIINGLPRAFVKIVEGSGRNIDLERSSLRQIVEESFARLSPELRNAYGSTFADATAKLGDSALALTQVRTSVGKLLSLGLAD